ncbi:hypothetical protein [Allofournierella massiliensis]|uniref:hypothetical protein n=1 Tax=Allofournierella massiliensis TaxID=1650663 RepID=UPI0035690BBD
MTHVERYQQLLALNEQTAPKDHQYAAAFFVLSFDEELYSLASKPGMITDDGINFPKMRQSKRHLSAPDQHLLSVAHNLFSGHSSCPENPYWLLSQLPAPHYICALQAIGVVGGKLSFEIERGEFVFSDAPLRQTMQFYLETEKMREAFLSR